MANVLRQCDGFVNLTYKDAATKTVPQAISCGLPVLYANSGGVSEMVEDYGVGIDEVTRHEFSSFIPQLTEEQLTHGFSKYLIEFLDIKQRLTQFDSKVKFKHMLDGYFKVITAL
jgi:glycosyltransferase involved in cell wall biosynthesis